MSSFEADIIILFHAKNSVSQVELMVRSDSQLC